MKKKIISLVLCIVSIFALVILSEQKNATAENSYYSSVEGLIGEELLNALADLTQENHKNYNTYGEVRYMYEADQDPNNPSNVLDFYSQISVSGAWDGGNTWNREHVWPKALSGGLYTSVDNSGVGAGGDIHHIRPTIPNINSSRQDKKYTDFDYINATGKENKYNGVLVAYDSTGLWEPLDNVKGDIARILLYLYMHYSTEVEANSDFKYAGNLVITNVIYTDLGTNEAAWELLLDWNELDPVDSFERNRNVYCYGVTGVYNPFIDHPEYANMIFNEDEYEPGFKVYYSYDNDVSFEYVDSNKYESGELIKKPTELPIKNGHIFIGWTSDENTKEIWDFTSNTIESNLTLYPVFKKSDSFEFVTMINKLEAQLAYNYNETSASSSYYSLVTDINEINIGDQIIIVSNENGVAISTNQKSNNRGTTKVTIEDRKIKYISDEVEVITLVEGVKGNTFGFKVGNQYLYAASSSSNYLRTSSTLNDNASWSVAIDSNTGSATIKATGSNTRNWLRFNKTSDLFACYASGQQDVYIYKNIVGDGVGYEITKMDIIYTYEMTEELYQSYNYDYDFGFIIDEQYYVADAIIKDNNTYKVVIFYDATADFNKKINVKPAISNKKNSLKLYNANISNNYCVNDIVTKYLQMIKNQEISGSDLDKLNSNKDFLDFISNNY